MSKGIIRYWLSILIGITGLTLSEAQTLTLSNGEPGGDPQDAFDGNVFQAGNQFGDASIYALLSNGASFQIISPGESLTKTISSTGYFSIRPTGNMVVDRSKILNFPGTVTGSVAITVKPLSITTLSANVATETTPGSELTISYVTGAGTFPVELAVGKFKVQLLDNNGIFLNDLQNSTDQYAGREQFGSSRGGTRYIKATIPASTSPGTYRVRVITQGLITNVIGSPSSSFIIRANAQALLVGSVGSSNFCAGTTVSFPFSTSGTFPSGNLFKVQLINPAGTAIQDLAETNVSSPITATLPSSLSSGSYKFRIVATTTSVVSNTGGINISALPTMTISSNSTIQAGSTATVQLTFTGTPPWSLNYTDYRAELSPTYTRSVTFPSSSTAINPTLYVNTTYNKNYINNFRDANCGTAETINGSAQISVTPITITTASLSGTYCPGSTLSVPFTMSSSLPTDAVYQVQLSDPNGNFQNGQIIGIGNRTSPVSATLPQTAASGTGYKVRIVLQPPTTQGAINYNDAINPVPVSLSINRPDPPIVSDISFCPGSTTSQLTATGVNLKWYADGGAQVLSGAPTPANDRSSRYNVSQTVNGCESALATINATLKAVPSAPSVSNVSLCQGGQGQFSTTIPGALWYSSATGGTGSSQPPILSSQSAGSQTVYVSQTVDGCESPRTAVTATVYSIPSAPAVQTPSPICQYALATPLSATGQNLIWYDQSGRLSGTPTPETTLAGTKSYSVSQTINGCESPRSLVEQTIRAAPATPTASSVRYCVGDVPRSLTANGSTIKWYATITGGTGTTSSPAFFTETANVFTFYVTQTDNNNCESMRLPVSVSVVAPPSPPTVTANQVVCQFAQVNALTASPVNGLLWQGSGITGTSETAPTPVTTQPATFTYSVSQRAGSCTSTASLITFTVRKLPDAPGVVSPITFCIGQNSSPLSATAVGKLRWYVNADHTGYSSTQVLVNTQQASIKTYYVTQTDDYTCESLNSVQEVRVSAKATARLTGDGDIYAGDSTAIRIRLTGDGPWTFTNWDSKSITTSDSLYVKWERPTATRTYVITNLRGACGSGDIQNNYTLIVRTPLSAQLPMEPFTIKAYPNPTTGDISVEWSSPINQTITLQIVNSSGKIIQQVTRQANSISQTDFFQLGSQPPGRYFLKALTPSFGVQTRPLVKQ